ncbi:lytic murein transglycosylase [Primorskyibacter sp. S187A]|uniref:lytic murein transglycosylase n=1 Tax=Primorskyibacter sp. S187A TaxID=3415130 RepID=UPI003C7B9475
MLYRFLCLGIVIALMPFASARAQGLDTSPRPFARVLEASQSVADELSKADGLAAWVEDFVPRAERAGIAPEFARQMLSDVTYDPDIIRRDRNQSEFTKTIWDYLDTAVSDARIRNGKSALERHAATLGELEKSYGVEQEIIVAIWGLESAYGAVRGKTTILDALATLAYDGRRGAFFEGELIAALTILQAGDTGPDQMRGSWAGAMGHTQFMPSSYLAYAVDHDQDGRRDIWSDDPTDALASTAAYLKHFGWVSGQPWGVEVQLPEGFDYTLARRDNMQLPSLWAESGVVGWDGRPVPDHGQASVLLPAGAQGAAFLVFDNFEVLERYNTADAYVIGVGHLADRIAGGSAIQASWPRDDRALTLEERLELQRRLTSAGFDTQGIDGKIGPLTIQAVRDYQRSIGVVPDGYASLRILKQLRS